MKKYICWLATFLLLFSLVGCGEDSNAPSTTQTTVTSVVTTTLNETTTVVDPTTTSSEEVITTEATTTTTETTTTTTTKATTTAETTTTASKPTTVKPTATTTEVTATTTEVTTTTAKPTTTTTTKPPVYTFSLQQFNETYDLLDYLSTGNDALPLDLAVVYGIQKCGYSEYFTSANEFGNIFHYTIPEAVVLETMRKAFVVSDALFDEIKSKGSYSLNGPCSATYENGFFVYEKVDGWGGLGTWSKLVSLTDNKDGTMVGSFQLYCDDEWYCNYKVVYTYKSTADYTLNKDTAEIRSTDNTFIHSIRVKSVQEDLR